MKSKIYSSDYVKTTSKGQYWITAFIAIGFLLAFPVAELIMLGNWMGLDYETAQLQSLYANLWQDGLLITGTVTAALAGLINGISGFWYLYSSRKVDFYHSLPVKRSQMFWHRVYVGILYYMVPYLVMEFLAVCIGAMRGFFSLHLMKLAFFMCVLHFLLYLLFYFTTVFVIILTGNILMGALCLMGIHAYGPALALLLAGYQRVFFENYAEHIYGTTAAILKCSPVVLAGNFVRDYADERSRTMLLVIVIVTVLFGAGAYFAYLKRRPEKTGRALVYKASEHVIGIMVSVPVGLGVGYIFYILPRQAMVVPWWIFGMVFGTVLAHGILQVIYHLDFRKFVSGKIRFGVSALLVAVIALIFKLDLTGYDTYMPAYDNLESLSIGFQRVGNVGGNENFSKVEVTEDGRYIFDSQYEEEFWELTNADVGKSPEIYDALSRFVKREGKPDGTYYYLVVKYTTTSGRKVYREYMLNSSELKNLRYACYEDDTMKNTKYSFLRIDPKYLNWVSGSFYDGKSYGLFQDEREKWKELILALREDIKEAGGEAFTGIPCASLYFEYESVPEAENGKGAALGIDRTRYFGAPVYVYPQFERTVALLKETGYPMSMEEVPIEEVKIVYNDMYDKKSAEEDGGSYDAEEGGAVYSEEEELAALKACLIPGDLIVPWVRDADFADVIVKIKGESDEMFMHMLYDKLPDFIEEPETEKDVQKQPLEETAVEEHV